MKGVDERGESPSPHSMRKETILEIKDRVSAQDVCARYGISMNRAGFARCLFHSERTPSMKVYERTGGYHCFGCGANGSVIDLVMQIFRVGMAEACEIINKDFGLSLDLDDHPHKRRSRAELLAEAKREYEARRERKKSEDRLKALERAQNEAEEEVIRLQRVIHEFDPRRNSGEITDEYADAVRRLPAAMSAAEEAEEKLYEELKIGIAK